MSTFNPILFYLNRRQLGYDGIQKNVKEIFIDQLGSKSTCYERIEKVWACKFSKNKNNLHLLGYSLGFGDLYIQQTLTDDIKLKDISKNRVEDCAIYSFAWAEPEMKIVTGCENRTSKLFSVTPTGSLVPINVFQYNSFVNSVMFCPGSSDVFCGGAFDASITIWDARVNKSPNVSEFNCRLPNAHVVRDNRGNRIKKRIISVIYKDDKTIISSAMFDGCIKIWDLRNTSCHIKSYSELEPKNTYYHGEYYNKFDSVEVGFTDLIINPQLTHLYAATLTNIVYCYSLENRDTAEVRQFYGPSSKMYESNISISNDGRYLFGGTPYNAGVIWDTTFPNTEEPSFNLELKDPTNREITVSDWCADERCMKLVTATDTLPVVWKIQSHKRKKLATKIIRTSMYKLKMPPKELKTPIKLDAELKKKYGKETEKNMEDWDNTTSQI